VVKCSQEGLQKEGKKLPTYVFTCTTCGKVQEITETYEKLAEIEEHLKCDCCGGVVKRKLAPFVTHFNYTRNKHE
jgi:predicted nucleic acid-binding Zn ribbon protein